jgi:hypothetical protein
MATTPTVFDLFYQAVIKGSLAVLHDIRHHYSWKAISIELITGPHFNEGDTSLQVAVQCGHYDVVEFLVHQLKYHVTHAVCPQGKFAQSSNNKCPFSWDKLDYTRTLPSSFVLPSAAVSIVRDITGQVPIIKLIEYLVDVANDEPFWLEFVLNSFVTSSAITRPEKIVALELMGAAFIFKQILHTRRKSLCKKNPTKTGPWRGLQCWKSAMIYRRIDDGDGDPPIPKIPYVFSEIASSAFGDTVEFMTLDELDLLEHQSTLQGSHQDWHLLCGPLVVQALLVSKRIFSQNGADAAGQQIDGPNSFHLDNLLHYGLYCKFHQQYSQAINVSLLILEHSKGFNPNSSPKCVKLFAETFDLMLVCLKRRQPPNSILKQELSSANLLAAAKFGIEIFTNMLPVPPMTLPERQLFDIIERTYFFISNWLPRLNQQEVEQLTEYLSRYIHLYNENSGVTSLLHVAIEMVDYHGGLSHYSTRHAVSIIQLLLEAGADPNATDRYGKTPLHFLAGKYSQDETSEAYFIIFQALLDAGVYLDPTAPNGKTVLCMLKDRRTKHPTLGYPFDPFIDSLIGPESPLSSSPSTFKSI